MLVVLLLLLLPAQVLLRHFVETLAAGVHRLDFLLNAPHHGPVVPFLRRLDGLHRLRRVLLDEALAEL